MLKADKGCPAETIRNALQNVVIKPSAARMGRNRWAGETKGLNTTTEHYLVLIWGIDLLKTYMTK